MFNFVSSGKGGVSPRRRSLNRESGEEPCSESGAVPAAVSLFPCVGRSEQSLSPSGGGKTARGETSQKTCPCSRASMLRVQSGMQVFPGFPEPAFTSRYFLPEEKGRSLFVPAIFTVPHRGASERRFSLMSDRWGDAIAPICSHFKRRGNIRFRLRTHAPERRLFLERRVRKRRKRASA